MSSETAPAPMPAQPTEPSLAETLLKKYDLEEYLSTKEPLQPVERVYRPIRMRVRYTCHNCSTIFGHDKTCINCQHRRCTLCVRYPKKKDKKLESQPETATSAEPLGPKACHECQTSYEDGTEACPNCHHQICDKCQVVEEAATTEAPVTTMTLPGREANPVQPAVAL